MVLGGVSRFSIAFKTQYVTKGVRMKNSKNIYFIELLVVVIIIGILAAIAIPAYTGHVLRARRATAKTALEQVRAAQEMWRAEKGSYSTNQAQLQTTMGAPGTTISTYYSWSFTATGAAAWIAQAAAQGSQASDGNLTINQDGVKLPADKWAK
jgi:type IV pilus assembly protein PilE